MFSLNLVDLEFMRLKATLILAVAMLMVVVGLQFATFVYSYISFTKFQETLTPQLAVIKSSLITQQDHIQSGTKNALNQIELVAEKLLSDSEQVYLKALTFLLIGFALAGFVLIIVQEKIVLGLNRLYAAIQGLRKNGPGSVAEVWSNDEFASIVSAVNVLNFSVGENNVPKSSFEALLEVVDHPCVVFSKDGTITNCNYLFASAFEKNKEELLGESLDQIANAHTEVIEMLEAIKTGKKPSSKRSSARTVGLGADEYLIRL